MGARGGEATVSEFNQPWPNTHGAELNPSLAAFGAFQDWDGIIHFAYSHGRGWDDGVPNGFNINGDWTKFAVVGQSAWLFRTGAVRATEAPLDVPVSAEQRNLSAQAGQSAATWVVNRAGLPRDTPLTRGVRLAKDAAGAAAGTLPSDTGELTFNKDAKLLLLNARGAAGIFGSLGKTTATAGPLDVQLAPSARGFATVLLTARDDRPIATSRSLLLSVPGYSLRAGPQLLKNYPGTTDWWTIESSNTRPSGDLNGGKPPTWMERVEAYVTLRTNAVSIVVSPLDGAGEPTRQLPEPEIERIPGGFRIHVNGGSPWYAITAHQPPPRRR